VPICPPGTEADAFPPILVNIGDLMHFWTNGLLKSTVHRVVFPEGESEDRYSIAYFCHPLNKVEIEAVPSKMIKERGRQDEQQNGITITAEGYLKKRLAETYGWGRQQDAAQD
jgi:isopenicillin N synthase-like dioxygenase